MGGGGSWCKGPGAGRFDVRSCRVMPVCPRGWWGRRATGEAEQPVGRSQIGRMLKSQNFVLLLLLLLFRFSSWMSEEPFGLPMGRAGICGRPGVMHSPDPLCGRRVPRPPRLSVIGPPVSAELPPARALLFASLAAVLGVRPSTAGQRGRKTAQLCLRCRKF